MIKRNVYKKLVIKHGIKSGRRNFSRSIINSLSPYAYYNYSHSYTQDRLGIGKDTSLYLNPQSYSRTNEFRRSQPC